MSKFQIMKKNRGCLYIKKKILIKIAACFQQHTIQKDTQEGHRTKNLLRTRESTHDMAVEQKQKQMEMVVDKATKEHSENFDLHDRL